MESDSGYENCVPLAMKQKESLEKDTRKEIDECRQKVLQKEDFELHQSTARETKGSTNHSGLYEVIGKEESHKMQSNLRGTAESHQFIAEAEEEKPSVLNKLNRAKITPPVRELEAEISEELHQDLLNVTYVKG